MPLVAGSSPVRHPTSYPRSSVDQSKVLLPPRSGVRVPPGVPVEGNLMTDDVLLAVAKVAWPDREPSPNQLKWLRKVLDAHDAARKN